MLQTFLKNYIKFYVLGQCETSLDTVFSWMGNRRTYFMKGGDSWRFDDVRSETERGYPKKIKDQWIGVPDDVDEGFLWSRNWVTYFFKVWVRLL